MPDTPTIDVIDAFPAGRGDDGAILILEYIVATLAEMGRPETTSAAESPVPMAFMRRLITRDTTA